MRAPCMRAFSGIPRQLRQTLWRTGAGREQPIGIFSQLPLCLYWSTRFIYVYLWYMMLYVIFLKNALYPFPPISWKLPPAILCLVRKRSDSPAGTERPNLQVEWQAVSGIRFFSGLNSLNCATMAATKVVNFRQCHSSTVQILGLSPRRVA